MTAAALIQKYPEIIEPLREGRLHLTSLAQLARVITPENRAELIPRFCHLSKREAKEVVAELVPAAAPPLRTVVTAAAAPPALPLAPALLVRPEEPPPRQPVIPVGAPAPARPCPQPTQVEPLTAELRRIHVTVSRRLLDELAAARDVLSHSHPGATDDEILEVGLDLVIARHRKRRGIGAKPRAKAPGEAAPAPTPSSSHHPQPPRPCRGLARRLGPRWRALRLAPRARRRLRVHPPARARSREGLGPGRGDPGRRVPPALP